MAGDEPDAAPAAAPEGVSLAEAAAAPGVCWPFVLATPATAAPLAESVARKDEPAPAFPLRTVATDVLDAFVSVLALVPAAAAAAVVMVVAIFFAGAAFGLGAAAEAVAVVTGACLGAAVVVVFSGVTLRKKFGSKGSPKRPMSRLSMGLILTCSFSRITAALGMRALSSHITPVLPLVHTHS